MIRISGIVFPLGIRIRQQRMPRQRLNRKCMGSVEIEILFKTVGVKEIIANPSGWHSGELPRIKIKLESLPGSKNDQAILGSPQHLPHIPLSPVIYTPPPI